MATANITGTIHNASGVPVLGVVVTLTPQSPSEGGAEAIGGIGIILSPVELATAADGTFTMPAEVGFVYRLEIEAIAFNRVFTMPAVTVRFDLIGLVPAIESVADFIDDADIAKNLITIKVEPLATVRERFETVAIEKSTTGAGGPFVEIDDQVLEDNKTFYESLDPDANTVYYRVRYKHSGGDASQYSDPRFADSQEAAILISVDELKDLYLFGVDLTDPNTGEPYPDRMLQHYINAAVGWMEKSLDIKLLAQDFLEVQDHYAGDYGRWGWFQLDNYPVRRIDEVAFQYPSMTEKVVIDLSWIVLVDDGLSGQLQVVPGQGNIADVLLIPGQLMPLWSGSTGRVPGVWRLSYRAGFEPGLPEAEGGLPADIKNLIGMAASIGVFDIAGDLVAGAGIASLSISVPGLSQSIGTTSSATNSGYGARIKSYQEQIKKALPNLRRFYGKGTRMTVV